MKKVNNYLLLLLLVCLLCAVLVLSSCEQLPGESATDPCSHEPSDWIIGKEASCAEEGEKHKECTLCDAIIETVTIDKTTSHVPSNWIVDKNASCTEEGSKHKECTVCGANLENASIDKANHTEKLVAAVEATCTESGLSAGKICSKCNATIVAQELVPAKNHTEKTIVGKKSTCTEAGLSDGKKCSVCNVVTVEQQPLPLAEHIVSDWIIDKSATPGAAGHKYKECLECGTELASEVIPALPEEHVHVGDEWIVTLPATCTAKGERSFVCSCGITMLTEDIDVIPHSEEIIPAVAASCKSTGLTQGKKCSVCDKILVRQSITAKADHTEETVLGVAAGCTESGLTDGKQCTVCGTTTLTQLIIPPTGHNFVGGACANCGISEPYGIWIVDGQGNQVSDIIVKIMQNGEMIKMYPYNGEFLSLSLESGTYQIELDLSQCGESYTFDESVCVITPDKRTTTIRLFKTVGEPTELFVGYPISTDYLAYYVGVGATKIPLTQNDYTFLIFEPEDAAIYTVTYECDTLLAISYHGASFFVQGNDITDSSEIKRYENGISINVYASNIGSSYVIGVKSTTATSCVLNIKNAGDPGTRIENEPWTPYLEDESKLAADLAVKPEGTYTTVDLTDLSLKAIYNEADGYYHLGSEDGPILFIDLTSNSSYISSIQIICGNQRMGAYIYDDNGNVVEKRSYNELFHQYGMPDSADISVDQPIIVPLTLKLAEAIQTFGSKNGWWDPDSSSNIFTAALFGAPYNQEFAWLLFCGYYS